MQAKSFEVLPGRIAVIALLSLSTWATDCAPVRAELSGEPVFATLRARAEAPPESASSDHSPVRGAATADLLFSMTGADNAACVRSLPDINGDGRDEVLVGIDESGTDNLFALDGASSGTATVLWSIETADGASGGSPFGDQSVTAAADSGGDGFDDVLFGTAYGGRTAYRFDGEAGSIRWRFDTYQAFASGWVYSLADLGDMDGDGLSETAFGVGSDSNRVYLIDGASSATGQATVRWAFPAFDGVLSVRDLGDVNGDGDHDVVVAVSDDGQQVICLDGGSTLTSGFALWTYNTGATAYAVGVMPDISGDGIQEALAVIWQNDGSSVRALDGATGTLLWSSTEVFSPATMVDVLADVTGDGVPEVLVGSFENAVIVLDGSDGSLSWKTSVGTLNGGDVWTLRAIDDLDGDGTQDVVAGSFDQHVYALNGVTGTILWSYDTGNRVFSVHPLGDLDGDGRPDVVAGTQDTNTNVVVHVLSGAAEIPIFVDGFELGNTTSWTATMP